MPHLKDQLQAGEEIVYIARPTKLTMLPIVLLGIVILVSMLALWYTVASPFPLVIAAAVVAICLVQLVVQLVVLRSNEYVLTTRRLIKQTGILTKSSVDSYLEKINNVEHRQTLWGRLFGYGDVEIDTASETGTTRFAMISNPLAFKRAILETKDRARPGEAPVGPVAATPAAERIRHLKGLLDDGLISQEEYDAKRKRLVEEL